MSDLVGNRNCWFSHAQAYIPENLRLSFFNNILLCTDEEPPAEPPSPVKNVDDFVPDIGELDASFLDDTKDSKDPDRNTSQEPDSDR